MERPGYFANEGKSYVVTELYTKIPFTNVLYNEKGYLTELTGWGTGTASVKFEDKETCFITPEEGKALYLRNERTGKVWCPGAEPMHSAVDGFQCEHGDGYSIVSSEYEGIHASVRIFVPDHHSCEIWTVELTNKTGESTEISVVPMFKLMMMGYAAPRFGENPFQSYITAFCDEGNMLYFESRNPNTKGKPYDAVLAASERIDFYSGCDRKTLAAPQQLSYPYALLSGQNLDSGTDVGGGGLPFMAVQCIQALEPGETKRVDFLFGTCRNKEEGKELVSIVRAKGHVEKEFTDTISRLKEKRERLVVKTPNEKVNYFVNTWLKKGLEYCLRKKDATRDNLQFALGLVYTEPQVVKDTIKLAMRYQYRDGHTVRSWKPLDETYYSDGPFWIVLVTCEYLKFTDDMEFLNETVPYFDGGEATVLEHLKACIGRFDADRGPHDLCLARWADWNDALNLPDANAESVFVSMAFAWNLKDMTELLEYIGQSDAASEYRDKYEDMKRVINEACWDEKGEYYVRGYSNGKVVGGSASKGSVIYANPQTWAILSGVVTEERLPKIMAAVNKYIETDLGCLVNYPAYAEYSPEFGRISYQVPGTTENGAVYCHATAFKINADIQVGDGERAYDDLKKILPDSEANPYNNSGALPYTLTSCYATNPMVWGRTGRPWLTGSQGWVMRCVVEGLLGIRKTYGGFLFEPAFPKAWDLADCTVERMGTRYHFSVERTGTKRMLINERVSDTAFVPFSTENEVHISLTLPNE